MNCPHCGKRIVLRNGIRPRRAKQTFHRKGHEYLVGVLAYTRRRLEIFRNAGGEATWFNERDPSTVEEIRPATCQGCVEPHLVGWNEGHWHHACTLRKKCDAVACSLFVCPIAHRLIHGRFIGGRGNADRIL